MKIKTFLSNLHVIFLSAQGLPFQGDDEGIEFILNSLCLKLISEYDPFLSHLSKYTNKGSSLVSTYEPNLMKFIHIMTSCVLETIDKN